MTVSINRTGQSVYLFSEQISFDQLSETTPVRALERYWRGLPATAGLPSRSAILPEDIPRSVLSWILLLDVVQENGVQEFRYRLVGTSNCEMIGRDVTGMLTTAAFGADDKAGIAESYRLTAVCRAPTFWRAAVPHELDYSIPVFRGIFPLSSDGRTVDKILAATVPETADWRF